MRKRFPGICRTEKATGLNGETEEPDLRSRIQADPPKNDAITKELTPHPYSQSDQVSVGSSDDRSLGSGTNSFLGGLVFGSPRAGSRAESNTTYSSDLDERDIITNARTQIRSIPDPSELLPIDYQQYTHEEPPKQPVQISKLIEFVGPGTVFGYLPIRDVLAVGKVNRHLKTIVDNYFIHDVLPRTKIYVFLDHIVEDGSPPSGEYQCLYPVIRRIEKDKRTFPDNRVIFEPDFREKPRYTYRKVSFNHVEIKFHLGRGQPKNWLLNRSPAARTPYSYRAAGVRKSHNLPYTRMFQYMRFDTFENSPIYTFYKDVPDSDASVVLHAISIPLNYLRQSLSVTIPDGGTEAAKQTASSTDQTAPIPMQLLTS